MTVGQFFLGLVGIFIATLVYRWQKSIDRQSAVLSEQREVYAKYLASSKQLYLSQPYKDVGYSPEELNDWQKMSAAEIENYSLRDQISILAPESVVKVVQEHDECLRAWKIAFTSSLPRFEGENPDLCELKKRDTDLRKAYFAMKEAMRNELTAHSNTSFWAQLRGAK